MLQRTAAAEAEVRARPGDAFGRGFQDLDHLAPPSAVALAGDADTDTLARQHEGNENRASAEAPDPVAAPAQGVDSDVDLTATAAGPCASCHDALTLTHGIPQASRQWVRSSLDSRADPAYDDSAAE